MSARVNLLPPELAIRRRLRRRAQLSVALLVLWVVALGGVYVLKLADVAEAEQAREDARGEVARLETELVSLDEYRVLSARIDARSELLSTAMADEISWARVLNDVSMTFPEDASMLTLAAAANPREEGDPAEATIDNGSPVASVTFSGYSVDRLAPGIEGVVSDFEEAGGFVNSYLQMAQEAEIGTTDVTNFNGKLDLNDEALTHRYDNGLPDEVTP